MCCHQIHLNPLLGLIFFTNSHNISVTSWPFGFILLVTFLSCFMIGSLLCWWLIPLLVLWIFWEDPRNFCLTWRRNLLSASDSSNTFALALEFATICWISSFSASISAICRYQECFLCFWRNNFWLFLQCSGFWTTWSAATSWWFGHVGFNTILLDLMIPWNEFFLILYMISGLHRHSPTTNLFSSWKQILPHQQG